MGRDKSEPSDADCTEGLWFAWQWPSPCHTAIQLQCRCLLARMDVPDDDDIILWWCCCCLAARIMCRMEKPNCDWYKSSNRNANGKTKQREVCEKPLLVLYWAMFGLKLSLHHLHLYLLVDCSAECLWWKRSMVTALLFGSNIDQQAKGSCRVGAKGVKHEWKHKEGRVSYCRLRRSEA